MALMLNKAGQEPAYERRDCTSGIVSLDDALPAICDGYAGFIWVNVALDREIELDFPTKNPQDVALLEACSFGLPSGDEMTGLDQRYFQDARESRSYVAEVAQEVAEAVVANYIGKGNKPESQGALRSDVITTVTELLENAVKYGTARVDLSVHENGTRGYCIRVENDLSEGANLEKLEETVNAEVPDPLSISVDELLSELEEDAEKNDSGCSQGIKNVKRLSTQQAIAYRTGENPEEKDSARVYVGLQPAVESQPLTYLA